MAAEFFDTDSETVFHTLFATTDVPLLRRVYTEMLCEYIDKYASGSADDTLAIVCEKYYRRLADSGMHAALVYGIILLINGDPARKDALLRRARSQKVSFILQFIGKALKSHLRRSTIHFERAVKPHQLAFYNWYAVLHGVQMAWRTNLNPLGMFDFTMRAPRETKSREQSAAKRVKREI